MKKNAMSRQKLTWPRNRYCSPRKRAQQTLELFNTGFVPPWQQGIQDDYSAHNPSDAQVVVSGDLREWEYGDYEGRTSAEINAERKKTGQSVPWNLWQEGCPGGE